MKQTNLNILYCLITLLGWTLSGPVPAAAAEQSKPNIIVILADDPGYETIGAYGGTSYRTPRIDKLYKDGALYDIANDVLKKTLEGKSLTPEIVKIRDRLKAVIENNTRPGFYK